MSIFDDILKDLTKNEKDTFSNNWRNVTGVVNSVNDSKAVVAVFGGLTKPLSYPQGSTISPGSRVIIAVKGTSAMHISTVLA